MRPRGERYIFQYVFYEYWHRINLNTRNRAKKSLFYCYAIFVAKRLLLTNKKQNLSEFNLKVIGYEITLLF